MLGLPEKPNREYLPTFSRTVQPGYRTAIRRDQLNPVAVFMPSTLTISLESSRTSSDAFVAGKLFPTVATLFAREYDADSEDPHDFNDDEGPGSHAGQNIAGYSRANQTDVIDPDRDISKLNLKTIASTIFTSVWDFKFAFGYVIILDSITQSVV